MPDLAISVPCLTSKSMVRLIRRPWAYSMLPQLGAASRYGNLPVVLVLDILYAVLGDDLDVDALEVNGKTSLELLGAQAHDLETLLVVDVGVMVLVEQREAVVPVETPC
jgi:hypothetical protein